MERFRALSKREISKYKGLLDAKYAELTRSLPPRENIAIDRRPDVDDEAVLAAEREIQVRAFDRGATLLRNVIAALRRIENGTYGICDGCGQRIGQKRLDAVPWRLSALSANKNLSSRHWIAEYSRRQLDTSSVWV